MKKMITKLFFLLLLILPAVTGCTDKQSRLPNISGEVVLTGLDADNWTYFSFESGMKVGTSRFLSEEEDRLWAERRDWDIAFCGDYLKTNGGTSGIGLGGIVKDTTSNFLLLNEAPEKGYLIDSVDIVFL